VFPLYCVGVAMGGCGIGWYFGRFRRESTDQPEGTPTAAGQTGQTRPEAANSHSLSLETQGREWDRVAARSRYQAMTLRLRPDFFEV